MFSTLVSKWKHFSFRLKSNKAKFSEVYRNGGFSGFADPGSGAGSTLEQTEQLRKELPALCRRLGIRSIADAPCGDFTWMSAVDLSGIDYRGFDIVSEVIERNRHEHAREHVRFSELDVVTQTLPVADLIICRDCLVHLSNRDAARALANFKLSGARYLLATTFANVRENADMVSARGWRPLNLSLPPFSLPPPTVVVDERCTESAGRYGDKKLGLWEIAQLP